MAAAVVSGYALGVGTYREIEDVAIADCALDLQGDDPSDLFRTAVQALAAVTCDPNTLVGTDARRIDLDADALDLLLFDLLSEIIFLRDAEGVLLTDGSVSVTGGPPWHVRAELSGGRIDPARTERRADPKAVTFHQLTVAPSPTGWGGRVVLDI